MPLTFTLTRSEDDRIVAGVCGAIARVARVGATLVRLVFAILALVQGVGLLLYLAAWAAMDTAGSRARRAAVVLVLAAAAITLLQAIGFTDWRVAGVGVVAGGAWLLWKRGETR